VDGDDVSDRPHDASLRRRADAWDLETPPSRWTLAPKRRGPVPGVAYAELPVRAAALVVDLALASVVGEAVARITISMVQGLFLDPTRDLAFFGVVNFAPPVALVVALTAYFLAAFRATPGQMTLGLFTVRAASGRPLTPVVAIWRAVLMYVPWLLLLLGVAEFFRQVVQQGELSAVPWWVLPASTGGPVAWYVLLAMTIVVDRRGRGLHDRLTGASVVRRAGSPS
jgi:uncharacterized RDD family membrane protein YckC